MKPFKYTEVREIINHWSLREKIGQMFMIGFKGPEPGQDIAQFIHENNFGAVILFSRNVESVEQIVKLTNQIHDLGRIPPFIFTDQEGGTVVQFREIAATMVSPMGLAATGNPVNARLAGRTIGAEMNACGVDGVLAPVLDVNNNINNPIIGIRSFSDNPDTVTQSAGEFLDGLNSQGVAGCGKHYPGHGDTETDSHSDLPVCHLSKDDLFKSQLRPFKALVQKGIDTILTAHILFPQLDYQPATFSQALVKDLLRQAIGFQGVVMTDCLEMGAIVKNFQPEEIVLGTIRAGIDLLVVSHSQAFQNELLDILCFLVRKGRIEERRIDESLVKILNLKQKYGRLKDRKIVATSEAQAMLRSHLKTESEIADQSVTVVANRDHLLPVDVRENFLLIEMQKLKATASISQAENVSMLEKSARKYLSDLQVYVLKLDEKISSDFVNRARQYRYIIVGLYSRNAEVEAMQARVIQKMMQIKNKIILVALGNPFDIRKYPGANTYIATYGFREVQTEALMRIMTGQVRPSGHLPVFFPPFSDH